ncbi:MAG: 2-C-methyl-D-erythritol 4-phosphate cytidylyltransferase [Phycisphaerae bacterium]|nr:2-C-methyl-D-erythritol 4-phosphate cytidylyltransferase [Phycisphaerae bacterium]
MAKVAVIVPAAGSGQRFGAGRNKIFENVGGAAMFLKTLEAFTNRSDVCQTLLVVSSDDKDEVVERFGGHLGFLGVSIVNGGATRTQSVRNALERVCDEAELVCVHDAARPCVAQVWIDAVFDAAAKTGAALLALPIHGTIKRATDDSTVSETLQRDEYGNLWEAQTPQVFARDILVAAYAANTDATDDAALVENTGKPVTLVPGDARNIKITTTRDLAFANAVIKTLPKPTQLGQLHPFAD